MTGNWKTASVRRQVKKTELGDALDAAVVQKVEGLLGRQAGEIDFEALEMAVRRKVMWVAARAVERRLNADLSDHTGPSLPCACGRQARYAGRRCKNFNSVLGAVRLERTLSQVVLGDGAKWIWNLADEHFPDAVQIVDRFHAKQHLSDVA